MSKTASEYLVEALEKTGVKRIYGVVGLYAIAIYMALCAIITIVATAIMPDYTKQVFPMRRRRGLAREAGGLPNSAAMTTCRPRGRS